MGVVGSTIMCAYIYIEMSTIAWPSDTPSPLSSYSMGFDD